MKKSFENENVPYKRIKAGEMLNVIATIIVENVKSCTLTINYDTKFFALINSNSITKLEGGSYEKDITFTLKALKPSLNKTNIDQIRKKGINTLKTWILINAGANDLIQRAGFQVEIHY